MEPNGESILTLHVTLCHPASLIGSKWHLVKIALGSYVRQDHCQDATVCQEKYSMHHFRKCLTLNVSRSQLGCGLRVMLQIAAL